MAFQLSCESKLTFFPCLLIRIHVAILRFSGILIRIAVSASRLNSAIYSQALRGRKLIFTLLATNAQPYVPSRQCLLYLEARALVPRQHNSPPAFSLRTIRQVPSINQRQLGVSLRPVSLPLELSHSNSRQDSRRCSDKVNNRAPVDFLLPPNQHNLLFSTAF